MMISLGLMVVSGTGDKSATVSNKPHHDDMMFVNMPV